MKSTLQGIRLHSLSRYPFYGCILYCGSNQRFLLGHLSFWLATQEHIISRCRFWCAFGVSDAVFSSNVSRPLLRILLAPGIIASRICPLVCSWRIFKLFPRRYGHILHYLTPLSTHVQSTHMQFPLQQHLSICTLTLNMGQVCSIETSGWQVFTLSKWVLRDDYCCSDNTF